MCSAVTKRLFAIALFLIPALAHADDVIALADQLAATDPLVAKDARLAIDALVHRAGAPGADAERQSVATALAQLLDDKRPDSVRREALNWLGYAGGDAQVPAIASLLKGAAGLADDARMALERIPGAAAEDALINALPLAAPSVRPGIAGALARRNVKRAADALIREARNDADKTVAWASFDALTAMGIAPNAILPPPVNGTQEELRHYAHGWLHAAAALSAQGDVANAERIYLSIATGGGDDELAAGALAGLRNSKSPKAIDLALGYLGEPGVHEIAKRVLIEMPGDAASDRLTKAYPLLATGVRAALIEILAARGAPSLDSLLPEAAKDETPEVRIAAARAAGQAPNDADITAVLGQGAPWSRGIAARIALDRADALMTSGNTNDARVWAEHVALSRVDEDALVRAWQLIERIGNAASLPVVENAAKAYAPLTPPAISNELTFSRTRAYVSVIAAQPAKDEAVARLVAMLQGNPEPAVNSVLLEKLRGLGYDTQLAPQQHGFITSWKIAGPIPDPDDTAYHTSYFDESQPIPNDGITVDGKSYPWKEVIADTEPAIVDLAAQLGPLQNVVAYAYATLRADATTPVQFLVGSNDGCEFYINGKRVHGVNGPRALAVDGDKVAGELHAGTNTILIKVMQYGGGWQFCTRVANPDGTPLDVSKHRP